MTNPLEANTVQQKGVSGARCEACHTLAYPAARLCAVCGGAMRAEALPTHGQLVTWTIVHRSAPEFPTPYILAWATAGESGLGVLGRFRASPDESRDQLRVGLPVTVWEEGDDAGGAQIWMEVERG